ncbi:glycoside hydrolase family 32 protein [Periconia macrospinosa]|uniref:Glycoside hydrolase family 32 protein n=1 Tax=Periconia macrospinosa TaxID=97972 RepID=A0A2V1EB09_9PLEO|nr:glycoside hydrolase family 32 protein [Periconia macrospinosa]
MASRLRFCALNDEHAGQDTSPLSPLWEQTSDNTHVVKWCHGRPTTLGIFASEQPRIATEYRSSQDTTSTYSQKNVPTNEPLPGNYGGDLRPQVHFSPPVGFMNDPNGMFLDDNGTYHLYYQYNPTENVAGNQHWGHATSQDLYTWTNQKIAIFPSAPDEGIFSGSCVVDSNNTSGFFPNQTNGVVAIYTLNTPQRETQDIAYSVDGGYTFTKYAQNPVIGSNTTQFRDPKVIWYEPTQRWVMVVAYPVDFKVGFFTSTNLRDWTPVSNYTRYGLTGWQYECPNLVEVPIESTAKTRWVLHVSINPGAPLGGSISWYSLGTFNGTHFSPDDATVQLTDFAKDNYAGQFFYGLPPSQDQITLNWASNWQYTNVVPTAGSEIGDGFRSVMSVPRGHFLRELPRRGLSLLNYPWNIHSIADAELASNSSVGNGTVLLDYSDVKSRAIYFEANITGLASSDTLSGSLNFTFSSSTSGEYIQGGFFIAPDNNLWLDRGHTNGFENPYFTDKFSATALYNKDGDGEFRVSGIVDRSIVEVFVNEGEVSATSVFFPTEPLDTMALRVSGLNETATVSVGVWALRAAWLGQADGNGTVVGNVTAT